MSIRLKILLGYVVTLGLGLFFFFDWVSRDLEPRYREATEEPLVDTAHLLASIVAQSWQAGHFSFDSLSKALDEVHHVTLKAQIYGFSKNSIDLRVYVTDAKGRVLFDSAGGKDVGKDYSEWRDVARTLQGRYGARSTKDPVTGESVLHVAAPIMLGGRLEGVLTVGKPTHNSLQLVERARWNLLVVALVTVAAMLVSVHVAAWMVTRPIGRLTRYVRALKEGKSPPAPRLPRGELTNLKNAFQELRETLEGRKYIETYVQTVTHEIKSPLSGIRGAAELLKEAPPAAESERFLGNILTETARIQTLIDKLLQLSSLQAKRGANLAAVDGRTIAEETVAEYRPRGERKEVAFELVAPDRAEFQGEAFWVKEALSNLVQNALEFAPAKSTVTVRVADQRSSVLFCVENTGSAIPEYAEARVFEPFYSLQRPDTGKKSSGLGLTIVRQVMDLHQGEAKAENIAGGVRVTLEFWKEPEKKSFARRVKEFLRGG